MSPLPTRAEQRAYQRDWLRERRAEWIAGHGPCAKCGSSENLEVDHVDRAGKVDHRVWSWSAGRREAELAKCQVLCGVCHLAKTAAENKKAVPHGTHSGYAYHRCRCADCTEAQRRYCRAEGR